MAARSETGAMKQCGRCGETKPLGSFNHSAATPTGRQSWCRACITAYIADRRTNPVKRDQDRATARARQQALEALASRHVVEFDGLLSQKRVAEGLSPIPYDRSGAA